MEDHACSHATSASTLLPTLVRPVSPFGRATTRGRDDLRQPARSSMPRLTAAWLHKGEGLAAYVWCLIEVWLARKAPVFGRLGALCKSWVGGCVMGNGCAAGGVGRKCWAVFVRRRVNDSCSCGTEVVEGSQGMVLKVVVVLWGCTGGEEMLQWGRCRFADRLKEHGKRQAGYFEPLDKQQTCVKALPSCVDQMFDILELEPSTLTFHRWSRITKCSEN